MLPKRSPAAVDCFFFLRRSCEPLSNANIISRRYQRDDVVNNSSFKIANPSISHDFHWSRRCKASKEDQQEFETIVHLVAALSEFRLVLVPSFLLSSLSLLFPQLQSRKVENGKKTTPSRQKKKFIRCRKQEARRYAPSRFYVDDAGNSGHCCTRIGKKKDSRFTRNTIWTMRTAAVALYKLKNESNLASRRKEKGLIRSMQVRLAVPASFFLLFSDYLSKTQMTARTAPTTAAKRRYEDAALLRQKPKICEQA